MKEFYFNDMQQEVLLTDAKDSIVVAGRGTGKSVLHARKILQVVQEMPRCTIGFIAANSKRAKSNTLPSMFQHLESWGYMRDVHWCIGYRPPKVLNWPKPLIQPENYENVISFYTGAIGVIISQDRSGTSNSLSMDYLDIDEAKFIDFEQLKDETFQANRGQTQHFGHIHYHHGMLVTSDMPVGKKGSWFLNYGLSCDRELIDLIQGMVYEQWRLEQQLLVHPDDTSAKRELSDIKKQLWEFRRRALFYKTYSSLVNLPILGEEFFRKAKRDLPPLTFMTSILSIRPTNSKDGFYSNMRPSHRYTSTNFHYLDSLGYDFDKFKAVDCRGDGDIQPDAPLCIAFDFNANINWMVVAQADNTRNRINILKSFYVKYERKLRELCDDFCKYYYYYAKKTVVFYYDATAVGNNYAVGNDDFKAVVIECLQKHGWYVNPVYIGKPMAHMDKHLMINQGFLGQKYPMPMFNEENNEDLLISIETAGVYNGKKDKRGEKLAETEEDRLESRTDGSDAFDTVYIGMAKYPQLTMVLPVTGIS